MKTLGLTGGIGSGKSSVAHLFLEKEIPVFNSDIEAKKLYTSSPTVHSQVLNLLGEEAFSDNQLNTAWVAQKVFNHPSLLERLNAIIHPAVQKAFEQWIHQQSSAFVVKEAAILFESGAYKHCDAVLTVTADTEIRVKRVMKRDSIRKSQVIQRIEKQWPEKRKIELSDFVLYNNSDLASLQEEFEELFPSIVFRLT